MNPEIDAPRPEDEVAESEEEEEKENIHPSPFLPRPRTLGMRGLLGAIAAPFVRTTSGDTAELSDDDDSLILDALDDEFYEEFGETEQPMEPNKRVRV